MFFFRIFLVVLILNLVSGCAGGLEKNNAFQLEGIRYDEITLVVGETTKEDLVRWFGEESDVIKLKNGNKIYEFIVKGDKRDRSSFLDSALEMSVGVGAGAGGGAGIGFVVGVVLAPVTFGASLIVGPIIGASIGALAGGGVASAIGVGPDGIVDQLSASVELRPVQVLVSEFNSKGKSIDFKYRDI